jgi:hypothetical protein
MLSYLGPPSSKHLPLLFIYADESVSFAVHQKIFSTATAALQEGITNF